MIFTDRTIIVQKGTSSINDTIVLYRGDKEVEIRFTLNEGSPFKFGSGASPNIIEKTEAAYGQLVIKTPNNLPAIFSEVAPTNGGKIVFTITAEMIDEITEVGNYTFQIRLFDESMNSRATLPEVVDGIEIREPIATENANEVGEAAVGYAMTTAGTLEDVFDSQGNYNKTAWATGDRITASKLNKIEAGIEGVNQKVANVDLSGYVTKEIGNADQITFSDGQTFQTKLEAGLLKGDKGEQGAAGQDGAIGPQGPQGPKGDKGDSGASALDDTAVSEITTYSSNKIETIKEELGSQIKEKATKQEVDVERKRIDGFTSLAEGSTTGDAEIIDARIGADNKTYDNLGSAIRNQVNTIKETVTDLILGDNFVKVANITQEFTKFNGYSATTNNSNNNNTFLYPHSNYNTYYLLAKDDFDIYFSSSRTNLKNYLTLIVYNSMQGSSYTNKYTYSSTEDTLPSVDNVAHINKGQYVAITVIKDVNFEFYSNYNYFGYVMSNKAMLNTHQIEQVKSNIRVPNFKLLVSKNSSVFTIYIPNLNSYTYYVFKHWVNTGSNSDTWKLWQYGITDNSLNKIFSSEENIEWEGVVRETGGSDFIGGYHGDETTTTFNIFIGGKMFDENSNDFLLMECDEVQIMCASNIFSSSDHTTLLFDRYKTLTFTKGGMKIKNRWIAKTNISLAIIYPVMMSLNRVIDGKNIVSYGRYNDKFATQILDPSHESVENSCSRRSNYATECELWGENLYAKCVIETSSLPSSSKYMFVDRVNQDNIAKMYYGYNASDTSLTNGTTIESTAMYILKKPLS